MKSEGLFVSAFVALLMHQNEQRSTEVLKKLDFAVMVGFTTIKSAIWNNL